MFAKIFQTKHGQVLLFRSYDEKAEQSTIVAIGESVNGITPKIEYSFECLEEAQKALAEADQASSENIATFLFNATGLVGDKS